MTKDAAFKRRVRARMAKTGESYSTARAQLQQEPDPVISTIESAEGREITIRLEDNVLNVTNGDAVVEVLQAPGVQVLPWRDVLHDGPVPAVPAARLREIRADFLSGEDQSAESLLRDFERRDRLVQEFADRDYLLWFEADLYDQLQVIQILVQLRDAGVAPERVRLVSVGEFPGIARFGGLGQLDRDTLLGLLADAATLTQADLDTAAHAWNAFTASNPSGLAEVTKVTSPALRFLGEAFGRLLQEYPWHSDGLSLTQRRLLLAIEDGASTAAEAFQEAGRRERRPYLGDWSAYAILRDLAGAELPLLTIDGNAHPSDPAFRTQNVELTAYGHDVLAGATEFEGIDRWIGGVHLTTAEDAPRWRYDERRESLLRV